MSKPTRNPSDLETDALLPLRDRFREARERVLKDAEGFEEIIHEVERLGILLTKSVEALGYYRQSIIEVAKWSPLAEDIPGEHRGSHIPFSKLYRLVTDARNDAVHQGAYARHLTGHLIQMSLVLEDALMSRKEDKSDKRLMVADFMVRDVVCAQPWEPVSFVRQQMLANSFSYLPMLMDSKWYLLSDLAVARFLRPQIEPGVGENEADAKKGFKEAIERRKSRLAMTVQAAISDEDGLGLIPAENRLVEQETPIAEVLGRLGERPLLVVDKARPQAIRGILMAFDLL